MERLNDNEPLQNVDQAAALIKLAEGIEPSPLHNRSFGFFGLTSTGKSTIVNKLIGMEVAEVGAGETTTEIQSYEGRDYILCDIPGLNDQVSYFTTEYISFWKGLTFKEAIRREVVDLGLTNAKRFWFVSAKNPDQFADWIAMVNHLLNY